MDDFLLDIACPQLASDEGPPFGEAGIVAMRAGELLEALAGEMLRQN